MGDKRKEALIARLTEKIVREYKPEKIILFGSYAYGAKTAILTSSS